MSDCPRFGKWFGGCRFEPRYDTHLSDRLVKINTYCGDMEALKDKTYLVDVCVRCGKYVDRKQVGDVQ